MTTITGTNFKTAAADNTVKFNGTAATVQSATTNTLTVLAPAGGTTGPVSVTTSDGTATGPTFTYQTVPTSAPTIASISPTSGIVGTVVVTITGTNFKTTPADNTVKFNGTAANVQNATATTLTVLAPAGGTTGPVTVTTSEGTATGPIFTYTTPTAVDVYVGGSNFNGTVAAPAYWKNGTLVYLPTTGTGRGIVNSIVVSGNDIYCAGEESGKATYWKNGTAVSLPTTALTATIKLSEATSIAVSGSDVYVAGYEYNTGTKFVAKYWKNGTEVNLTNGTNIARAYSIALSGSDVYVAGEESDQAKYWKNGTAVSLSTLTSSANSIVISGSDVYVAGSEYNTTTNGNVATYWKNGTEVKLSNSTNITVATSIAIFGSDVYVAGGETVETNNGSFSTFNYTNKYWKNGTEVILSSGFDNAGANSIAISGSDVYVAGYEYLRTPNKYVVKYWKNGTAVKLADGPTAEVIEARSIVVVPR